MSKMANVSDKEFCIKSGIIRARWKQVSSTLLCSVDIILSYFAERFKEMPPFTKNIKIEVWNCALICAQKVFFFIFSKTACISSNCSEDYSTITCSAPYSTHQLSPRPLGIMPLFVERLKVYHLDRCPISSLNKTSAFWLYFHTHKWIYFTIQLYKLYTNVHRKKIYSLNNVTHTLHRQT